MNTPRPLVRQLSTHHWEAAKSDMKEDSKMEVGTSYDLDGNVEWKFYIVKRGNILEKHTYHVKSNYTHIVPYEPSMSFFAKRV